MIYRDFRDKIKFFPVFSTDQLTNITGSVQILKNQLTHWQKKGLVIKLRRGLYILGDGERMLTPSLIFIANQLYSPSYVSCEYALAYHEIIPEAVKDITSVSTRKTSEFKNKFGLFKYQHIQVKCFNGFILLKDENKLPIYLAEPEKAIVDFVYLNLGLFNEKDADVFYNSYRFQNVESLIKNKMTAYAEAFKNRKLANVICGFCKTIKKG